MDNKYNWDLSSLYSDRELIFQDIELAEKLAHDFETNYQSIKFTKTHLKSSLDEYFHILRIVEKPMTYAHHKLDESTIESDSIRLEAEVKTKVLKIYSTLSFYMPKLIEEIEVIKSSMELDEFKTYHQVLTEICLSGKFTLNQQSEKLLADASESLSQPSKIYEVLTNGDLKFDDVENSDGEAVAMSHGLYGAYLMSEDRVLRKNAFAEMLGKFASLNLTLTTTYTGQITKDIFTVNTRGYNSTRHRALFSNNIDEVIYDNLLDVTKRNIKTNHDYVNLRKELLGYDELHLYDMYVPLISESTNTYGYEQAQELVIAALSPLGSEYVALVKQAFAERWIDVYEREGKRSGAYSGGCYDSKPFILLNYTNTLNDVYTLAHEIGHSIHTYLANHKQAYHNSDYVIFVAEIASTLNELLLTDYLLDIAESDSARAGILNYKLEQYRTTVIRQTMFADFEYESKKTFESGKKLASEDLNAMYYNLNKLYFGDGVIIDDLIKYEWSRIPHFYYNYYVYQYATSFCYSVDIFNRIKQDENFATKYLDFLSIGGSLPAIDSLATIDIDARSCEPYQSAFDDFADTLEKFKNIINLEDKC
ncbi:oligoendopeptidase F [Mollicutes bacterium LVI A0039]|nr:oligoendopeptidase F [Mollicutes bacterium LVI A0039]